MSSDKKPSIAPIQDGPFVVTGLKALSNQKGPIEAGEVIALCRCGKSANKPFCDGAHEKAGFSSANPAGRGAVKWVHYAGQKITIHDHRGVCSHSGHCIHGLAAVFRLKERPWIVPDAASVDEIIRVINMCPSGALSYSLDGAEHRDREGEAAILVAPDGPYVVSGGIDLLDTDFVEGASREHYTLCRCGGSGNKPFCDGAHLQLKFTDDKN